jgi:outer membrane protein TolC
LGLPPTDDRRIVPTTLPTTRRLQSDWDALVRLAEQRRPDVVELKLITEADQARLLQAENQALPQLNAVASYRWNGLDGEMPNGENLATKAGQFTDWTVGVNFSVPLGLRQARALVRQQQLIIARDRANVEQQLHQAIHQLAEAVRTLDSSFDHYLLYKESRKEAYKNVEYQYDLFEGQGAKRSFLDKLQAITDWGNAVTSEGQQLLTYNVTLANLERETGTILETHGLVFYEERFRSAGPLGILGHGRLYPDALIPAGEPQGYPGSNQASENFFDLRDPTKRDAKPETLPPPQKP